MAELTSVVTAVSDLEIGMYVTALDRPWMETSFMVQGFYITSQADIEELERHCKFVYIDVYRSKLGNVRRTSRVMGRPKILQQRMQEPAIETVKFRSRSTDIGKELFGHLKLKKYEDTVGFGEELGRAKAVFADLSRAFADMMEKFLADSVLDLSGIREAVNPMVESVLRNPDACVWLAGLRNEDGYAYRHAVSASAWVVAFGRRLGLPAVVLQRLATGGLLFDIGKLRVPKELLEKCERLTPGEFQLLKSHVEFGMEMLKDTGTLNRTVADMIESHHERHGGHGYPHGLKGDDIPVFARIAAIVDCYDAITSQRPYATVLSPSHAVKKMYAWRGVDFQAELVEEFIQAVGVYPAGTLVELSNGEVGVVQSGYRTRGLRPQLLMVLDHDKQPLREMHPVDLGAVRQDATGAALDISTSLEPGSFGVYADELNY
ncbi:MAG: HD-GYP domain-containing protein [Gammaproteobacteria bacterium]|nr:HD-GYP domain-containing protein [Gammaproteobacteria bacterium]